jgi:cbb3-type cytochrome oxidase subunit 3
MSVIPITVFFSLLLAGFFVALFLREHRRHRFASSERDSLLPLADERPAMPGHSATGTASGEPAPGDLYF